MKLARFTYQNNIGIGVVEGQQLRNLSAVWSQAQGDVSSILSVLDQVPAHSETAPLIPLSAVELLAPLANPQHFFAVGLNYADHAKEVGVELPQRPRLFNKFNSAINAPRGYIAKPNFSDTLDYEGELCLVIGKPCFQVSATQANQYIAGYVVLNDVSLREYVNPDLLPLGKNCPTFAPFGPWLTTADEIENPHNLIIKTWVNDELRQHSNTRELIFNCYQLIEWISRAIPLMPGDMITTGSPHGSGIGFEPKRYLQVGDVVRVEISGLGMIEHTVCG
ncbi:MAG: fumarylacetoacetate hydrolase family protein [Gammaproteobacteria bacterium]|nr:fumarylacetoacetate hydrolase family protein [Gammaproteobacteria bacterium]